MKTAPTCTSDADCPKGLICVDGNCVKDPFNEEESKKASEEETEDEG